MGYETKYTYVVIYREHARIKWCDLDKVSKLSKSVVVISLSIQRHEQGNRNVDMMFQRYHVLKVLVFLFFSFLCGWGEYLTFVLHLLALYYYVVV